MKQFFMLYSLKGSLDIVWVKYNYCRCWWCIFALQAQLETNSFHPGYTYHVHVMIQRIHLFKRHFICWNPYLKFWILTVICQLCVFWNILRISTTQNCFLHGCLFIYVPANLRINKPRGNARVKNLVYYNDHENNIATATL